MNYASFYIESENKLTDTFISIFAKGKPAYARHLRWMFRRERIVQPPVFQSVFPWQTDERSFADLTDLLGNDFIYALSHAMYRESNSSTGNAFCQDISFHAEQHPYCHQIQSWEAVLKRNKSIVVTTGTGSGKTECFTIPILKQLYDTRKIIYDPGVQAIFLYPLNALISSQRKRIHAWCDALSPKLSYAIYNGDTPENVPSTKARHAFPELIDRKSIRENPPQILFTNPSMLEYMMIRAADGQIIEKSNDLKWIILDEAHTYTGSAAAELALLLRRTLSLFGKTPNDVNFTFTSATMGDPDKEPEIRQFLSDLTGKNKEDFEIIGGHRVIPDLDEPLQLDNINTKHSIHLTPHSIQEMRRVLNGNQSANDPSVTLDAICEIADIQNATVEEKLRLIDDLSICGSATIDGKPSALLPVRAHFFGRSILGLFACTNPNCPLYQEANNADVALDIGVLTSYLSTKCPVCNGEMLDVELCNTCGEYVLCGEVSRNINDDQLGIYDYHMKDHTVVMKQLIDDEVFETDDDSTDQDLPPIKSTDFRPLILSSVKSHAPHRKAELLTVSLVPLTHELIIHNDDIDKPCYAECFVDQQCVCPECCASYKEIHRMSLSPAFESRLLSQTILKQCATGSTESVSETVYEGRKYLTFTDSRQNTAKIARSALIDVEQIYMRALIFHFLNQSNDPDKIAKLQDEITKLENDIDRIPEEYREILQPTYQGKVDELNKLREPIIKSFTEFKNQYIHDRELSQLMNELGLTRDRYDDYLQALFISHLGMRPIHGNSLETLGLVHFRFPNIENLTDVPHDFIHFFGYSDINKALQDWKDYLRIGIDQIIRRSSHYYIPKGAKDLVTQRFNTTPIFGPDTPNVYFTYGDTPDNFSEIDINDVEPTENYNHVKRIKLARWPLLPDNPSPVKSINRMILLLLGAKDIYDIDEITPQIRTTVNGILNKAWNVIKDIMLPSGEAYLKNGTTEQGYRLNILDDNRVQISRIKHIQICPVTRQCLDCTFRGISPMITGVLSQKNIQRFKTDSKWIEMPSCPVVWKRHTNPIEDAKKREIIETWFNDTFRPQLEPHGYALSAAESIFMWYPIFIATEHSAQIQSDILRAKEQAFEIGKLNVLNCSTTMEMGIDIGGLSSVVMHNVPPKPANYKQRAGRAGRRQETQSLVYTICNDSPIGRAVLDNPCQTLEREIAPSTISLSSEVIVQRHVNALLLGLYCRTCGTMRIRDSVGQFIQQLPEDNKGFGDKLCTLDAFLDYLCKNKSHLDQEIKNIVKNTALSTTTTDDLIKQTKNQIVEFIGKESDFQKQIDYLNSEINKATGRYKTYLNYRREVLLGENLISKLAGIGFLPSSSIPNDVVSLSVVIENLKSDSDKKSHQKLESKTQRPLSLAIQEYAPGYDVVIDGWSYTILGVDQTTNMQNIGQTHKETYLSACPRCGYIQKTIDSNKHKCPLCKSTLRGIYNDSQALTLIIEPSTGFLAGERHRTTQDQPRNMIEPALLEMKPWKTDADDSSYYNIRTSAPGGGQILFWNRGKKYGFAFCEYCGRMIAENGLEKHIKSPLSKDHFNPRSGKLCYCSKIQASSIRRNVLLAATIKTDICELKLFHANPKTFECLIYTLGSLICNQLSEYLGIESSEIDFGVTHAVDHESSLFFYDTASGGAGYVTQLPHYIHHILDKCLVVTKKDCCSTACTRCLIDSRSQRYADKLDKRIAQEWLQQEADHRKAFNKH